MCTINTTLRGLVEKTFGSYLTASGFEPHTRNQWSHSSDEQNTALLKLRPQFESGWDHKLVLITSSEMRRGEGCPTLEINPQNLICVENI